MMLGQSRLIDCISEESLCPAKQKLPALAAICPSEIVSNDDLSKILDTSDEWITTRSGIKQRHRAADGEATSDIALAAAQAGTRQCRHYRQ